MPVAHDESSQGPGDKAISNYSPDRGLAGRFHHSHLEHDRELSFSLSTWIPPLIWIA